jgi:hypothetical protein
VHRPAAGRRAEGPVTRKLPDRQVRHEGGNREAPNPTVSNGTMSGGRAERGRRRSGTFMLSVPSQKHR